MDAQSRVLDVSDDGEESLESTSAKFIVFRALGVLVFYYLVILIVFGYFDGWATDTNSRSWVKAVDAIYFASTTLSTVGYGDILPTRDETRMVTTLVLLLAFTFILREFNLLTEVRDLDIPRLPARFGAQTSNATPPLPLTRHVSVRTDVDGEDAGAQPEDDVKDGGEHGRGR